MKSTLPKILVYSLYIVLLILGLYHHEMWRDEYEEFLQARDSNGLLGLGNTMSQGHAMLWQGCLWIITRFTHIPLAMKIFHGLIAAAFAFLIVFKSPFKLWQSGLLLCSYFLLFEYAIISRCYAFGVLFFMLFAWQYSTQKRLTWKMGIILFLLANTSIYALILTTVLIGWLFLIEVMLGKTDWKIKLFKNIPLLIFAGGGVLLAYLQIRPMPDNTFPLNKVSWPFDAYRFHVACSHFFNAFVPVVKINQKYFWNTNFLMNNGIVLWFYPIFAFVLATLPFIKKVPVLLLWLGGVLAVLLFQYHLGFYYARYYGHFFIWWIVCMWLLTGLYENNNLFKKISNGVFIIIMSAQVIGGVIMYTADWSQKFSRGAEAANYLRYKGYTKNYMIGSVDFALSPISAELDRKIYYMQHKKLCSFTKWDSERLNSMDSLDLVEALGSAPEKEPIIFIATHPILEFEYFKEMEEKRPIHRQFIFANFKFYSLAYFEAGIERNERYWLFRAEKIK